MERADFTVDITDGSGETVIVLSGEVDSHSAPELRSAIPGRIDAGHRRLVLDLANVTFMDSTALGVLVAFLKHMQRLDAGSLCVRAPSPQVKTLFAVTGLDRYFPTDGHATA